jgi:hypothetical protein
VSRALGNFHDRPVQVSLEILQAGEKYEIRRVAFRLPPLIERGAIFHFRMQHEEEQKIGVQIFLHDFQLKTNGS